MRVLPRLVPVVLLLGSAGCYQSYSDLAGDAGDVPDGAWRFTDRNIPDRSIPVHLYFAAVPTVAWNGSVVAVVYQGLEPGSDARLSFLQLGERGNPIGTEQPVWSGGGIRSAIPHLVADGGYFLLTFVEEAGGDRLVVLRLDAVGGISDSVEASLPPGAVEPVVPPVVLDEYVLGAYRVIGDPERLEVFRVRRGDSFGVPELFELRLAGDYGGGPFALVRGSNPDVALLFYATADGRIVGEEYTDGLVRTSSPPLEVPATAPATDLVATWANDAYVFAVASAGGSGLAPLTTWSAGRGARLDEFPASLAGGLPAAAGYLRPAWGATFALVDDDRWRVVAAVAAEPAPGTVVRLAAAIDDGVGTRRLDDMPRSSIAWTGDGFLVVWDEWREEASAYGLYSSYLELHRGP
jgi:hypothetical protein